VYISIVRCQAKDEAGIDTWRTRTGGLLASGYLRNFRDVGNFRPLCNKILPPAFTEMDMTDPPTDADDRLAHWVREHGRPVRGYLMGLVGSPDVADDLTQEVFRRAWEARTRYQERGNARAFLLCIADRLACDRARRGGREVTLDEDAWRRLEPTGGDSPADLLLHVETRRQLAAALERLSPDQQRVLLLRYYGDLPFKEIADLMEAPLSTVLSHCRRGLAALRKLLVEDSP
jgi:RNA polymerase sigma-70 factor, ECF subfamily